MKLHLIYSPLSPPADSRSRLTGREGYSRELLCMWGNCHSQTGHGGAMGLQHIGMAPPAPASRFCLHQGGGVWGLRASGLGEVVTANGGEIVASVRSLQRSIHPLNYTRGAKHHALGSAVN